MTSNLENRLLSHNKLAKGGFTRKYRPWVVLHEEHFDTKPAALKREKALKTSRGRSFIKSLILN